MAASAENPWMIEVVAGILEPNETPENLAMRETFEKTGVELPDILPICAFFMAPGSSTEYCHLFCGRIDSKEYRRIAWKLRRRERHPCYFQRHLRSLLLESPEAKLIARSRLSLCSGCSLIIKTFGAVGLNPPKAKILDSGATANRTH